jgi:hypothetical protein
VIGLVAVSLCGCNGRDDDSEAVVDRDPNQWEVEGDYVEFASYGSPGGDAMVCAIDAAGALTCWGLEHAERRCVHPDLPGPITRAVVTSERVCGLGPDGVMCDWFGFVDEVLTGEFADFAVYGETLDKICAVSSGGITCSPGPAPFFYCGATPGDAAPTTAIVGQGAVDAYCTLDASGDGFCWGMFPGSGCSENDFYGCVCEHPPAPLSLGGPNRELSMDMCALRLDGAIVCTVPLLDPPRGEYSSLARTPYPFPAAVDAQGSIVTWLIPELVVPQPSREFVKVQPTGLGPVDRFKYEERIVCGIDTDGNVLCWGLGADELARCE